MEYFLGSKTNSDATREMKLKKVPVQRGGRCPKKCISVTAFVWILKFAENMAKVLIFNFLGGQAKIGSYQPSKI